MLQHVSIPNSMIPGNEQFYPISLLMGLLWIWGYCFCIVWWTYTVSIAYNLNFSILPMIIYPFGIVLRDIKKLDDMRVVLKVFKEKCSD